MDFAKSELYEQFEKELKFTLDNGLSLFKEGATVLPYEDEVERLCDELDLSAEFNAVVLTTTAFYRLRFYKRTEEDDYSTTLVATYEQKPLVTEKENYRIGFKSKEG